MFIIIGLGNPGEKFKKTRHNLGFMAVDFFVEKNNLSEFKMQKKYDSLISENSEVILVKPQTFMNNSGLAVKKLTKPYPLNANPLVIVHDDIDLPLGKLKISKDSGSGGHKGVDSIIDALGKKNFIRLRIGICPQSGKPDAVEKFVLQKFKKEEQEIINSALQKTVDALNFFIENGLEKTMNQFN